jgi:hypothetical protein
MSEQEASAKADEEVDKTMRSKVQYNSFNLDTIWGDEFWILL